MIKNSPYPNPDQVLPRAITCFFNAEIAAYSSLEIMTTRLMYAIPSDSSMNADEKSVRDADAEGGRRDQRRSEEEEY